MQDIIDIWNVLSLRKGALELKLLPGIGGRLWDIVFDGQSLLFQNPDLIGHKVNAMDLSGLPSRSPQFHFPLWGGEKTWIAPDSAWVGDAPFPTLDSGPYRVESHTPDQIEMCSEVCPLTHLRISRTLTLATSSTWSIVHRITNTGDTTRRVGAWSVMMLKHPAVIGVISGGQPVQPVFGNAGKMLTENDSVVVCDCAGMSEFKIGLPNPNSRVLVRLGNGGLCLACVTAPFRPDDDFAHSHPVEVFNSGDYRYCEAEWHSPVKSLTPDDTLTFQQTFHLWEDHRPPSELKLGKLDRELLACMS